MKSSAPGDPTAYRLVLERALDERGPRFRRLLETTKAVPWEADARTWRFTYVGPQAIDLLGYPLDEWYEPGFWASHIHRDDRERTVRYCLESSQRYKDYAFEYRMTAADGTAVWLHDVVSVEYADGEPSLLTGFMIDIGASRGAVEERRQLAGRLLAAQEEERRRLARELHDDLTQRLAGLAIEAGRIERRLLAKDEPALRQMGLIKERLIELSSDVQVLARRLHPPILDHLGLATALEAECSTLQRRNGLSVVYEFEDVPADLPRETALCIYRVAQECLNNVVRHAGTKEVNVRLGVDGNTLVLRVRDKGVGFDPAAVREEAALGLASMEERMRLIAGKLLVQSRPGRGTEIEARAPLTECG
jgi:PAS domain S-box-containing protein